MHRDALREIWHSRRWSSCSVALVVDGHHRIYHCDHSCCRCSQLNTLVAWLVYRLMPSASADVAAEELSHSLAGRNLAGRRAAEVVLVREICCHTAEGRLMSKDRCDLDYLVSLSARQSL